MFAIIKVFVRICCDLHACYWRPSIETTETDCTWDKPRGHHLCFFLWTKKFCLVLAYIFRWSKSKFGRNFQSCDVPQNHKIFMLCFTISFYDVSSSKSLVLVIAISVCGKLCYLLYLSVNSILSVLSINVSDSLVLSIQVSDFFFITSINESYSLVVLLYLVSSILKSYSVVSSIEMSYFLACVLLIYFVSSIQVSYYI